MLKNIWKDPVWSKVIAAAILAIASISGNYFFGWWSTLSAYGATLAALLFSNSYIPNWVIGLMVFFTLPSIFILLLLPLKLFHKNNIDPISWQSYVSDNFYNLRWSWSYSSSGQMKNWNTFCPHCDFQVFPLETGLYDVLQRITFKCDSCHRNLGEFNEGYDALKSKVERFAQQKLRNDTWMNKSDS
jgi:hypothetical protein